jgi:segregation and condensation protein A
MLLKHDHFALDNFEGSLDFLLCLIQKEEIDIYDIPIQELIQQYIDKLSLLNDQGLEKGSEFIHIAAYLVWLKSKALLPRHEQPSGLEEEIEDPHFEIIHHLIDYCRFKEAAKELSLRQEKQQACYFRGIEVPEWKKPLGLDHVSLEELCQIFKEMTNRAGQAGVKIQEENWRVSDKLRFIRGWLQERISFPLSLLLSPQQSRQEMIVIFLAILELMKSGEIAVCCEQLSSTVLIFNRSLKTEKEK